MPTYDYICEKCQHDFEQFQSITARALRKCPECGSRALKRLIGSGAGVIFKGSGFYQTDYRSQNYKNAEKNDKTAGTPKKDSQTESKDKKPDGKTKPANEDKKKTA